MLFIKTFRIRLSEDFRQSDEALLNDFLESVVPKQIESGMIQHPTDPFWSVMIVYNPREDITMEDGERILFETYEPLTPREEFLFFRLKAWRDEEAEKAGLPSHLILHDAHLMTLAKIQPTRQEELQKLKGVSLRKIEKYAEQILEFFKREIKK